MVATVEIADEPRVHGLHRAPFCLAYTHGQRVQPSPVARTPQLYRTRVLVEAFRPPAD